MWQGGEKEKVNRPHPTLIFRSLGRDPTKGSKDDLSFDRLESSFFILQIAEYLGCQGQGTFLLDVKKDKQTAVWMMDIKSGVGQMKKGNIEVVKPDTTLELPDTVFVNMFMGDKINGQKASMSGKMKIKGEIMLALKLASCVT
ncbi:hypothetical protein DFQ26_006191 [Actinomortierella ambigua]|nr:hypothetical protein DFQ26_006191 [Actinomortierella ambigua]